MNRREFLCFGPVGVLPWHALALQTEQGRKSHSSANQDSPDPIPEPHFPSRLHQFVWRNWELANTERIAKVIGASPEAVLELGSSMGLPNKRRLTDDQLARLYITVIRQNWHLLPEPQIIELLGWDREKYAFILKEDDFLDLKLGIRKPRCTELVYRPASSEEKVGAEKIRRLVRETFGQLIERPGEDLFAFVKDLSEARYSTLRSAASEPARDEVDISRGWSISAPGNLIAIARRFATYLRSALNAEVTLGHSPKTIHLELDAGIAGGREGFRIEVNQREIRIVGQDETGVLQALCQLQDRMEQREGPFLPLAAIQQQSSWDPRFLYSYFALYGDPLIEPKLDPFPDAYLERLSRSGINGVWMQAVLNTLAPSKHFPEFGAGWQTRLRNLKILVRRARQFGVRVYLYLNEPRGMPDNFFQTHPEVRGVPHLNLYAMCTSVPSVREWLQDSVAHIFQHVPELGGIFCITMSENLTNCFSQGEGWGQNAPKAANCPRCSKRASWEVIAEVITTLRAGVRQHSQSADVIAWDWAWGEELSENLIPLLPKDTRLLSEPGGGEYMLSTVGAGPRSTKNWQRARAAGISSMAKVQFNNTWEISAVPYIPVMHLLLDHCEVMARAGVTGLVASWTCGGYPSLNLAALKAYYFAPRSSRDEILTRAAIQRYGRAVAPIMVEAWRQFSDAFRQFPFGNRTLDIGLTYIIPTQHGPSNPLRLRRTGYRPGMMLFPYDDYEAWCGDYPPEKVQQQFAKMATLWNEGLGTFKGALPRVASQKRRFAELDLAIAETCYNHFQSTSNQLEFYMLREKLEERASRARMRAIAEDEIALAVRQFQIARDRSVIAYEASNHYYYTPLDLVEKVLNCRHVIDELDRQREN